MAKNDTASDLHLARAFGGALDNELADGWDSHDARQNVLRRAAAYADNYGIDAATFRTYVQQQVKGDPGEA